MRTLVLTICSRRVLEAGRSPAPTNATSDVQNSISTIEVAPSPGVCTVMVSFRVAPGSSCAHALRPYTLPKGSQLVMV